jgi:hypothetical protein
MISPAVGEAYGRAGELAERHGDERRLFQALYGVYQHNVGSGRIFAALPLAERLLSVTAHEDTDPGLRLQAHHALWTALLMLTIALEGPALFDDAELRAKADARPEVGHRPR